MLESLFHYLATPAPWAIRRRGHVGASVALLARSRRCRRAWAPHLAAARRAALAAAEGLPRRRTAMVLGSGLLDDVPLAELAAGFERVLLVDAVHPWPARLAAGQHANVARVTADLVVEPLDALLREPGLDLVVSANLLSQLPILPVARTEGRGADADPLGRRIVVDHLQALAAAPCLTCLVADRRQREEDRTGRVYDEIDLLHDVVLPPSRLACDWELAPFGEVARVRRLVHRVQAYLDWRRDGAAAR